MGCTVSKELVVSNTDTNHADAYFHDLERRRVLWIRFFIDGLMMPLSDICDDFQAIIDEDDDDDNEQEQEVRRISAAAVPLLCLRH
mmetsp:Transcript_44812/g.45420  ORF Transcript_44812/g.45420 Transcript_44812/m.45420 type:complete len:86 (-) Transcript_44812:917-1174(-)